MGKLLIQKCYFAILQYSESYRIVGYFGLLEPQLCVLSSKSKNVFKIFIFQSLKHSFVNLLRKLKKISLPYISNITNGIEKQKKTLKKQNFWVISGACLLTGRLMPSFGKGCNLEIKIWASGRQNRSEQDITYKITQSVEKRKKSVEIHSPTKNEDLFLNRSRL